MVNDVMVGLGCYRWAAAMGGACVIKCISGVNISDTEYK